MATPSPQSNNLSDTDIELLSSYLDNELTIAERMVLERRLNAEPDLRLELEELRTTTVMLQNMPSVAPPRSFTLDPDQVPTQSFAWTKWMRLSSALAVLILAVGITTFVFIAPANQQGAAESVAQNEAATEPMPEMMAASTSDDEGETAAGAAEGIGQDEAANTPMADIMVAPADEAVESTTDDEASAETEEEADALPESEGSPEGIAATPETDAVVPPTSDETGEDLPESEGAAEAETIQEDTADPIPSPESTESGTEIENTPLEEEPAETDPTMPQTTMSQDSGEPALRSNTDVAEEDADSATRPDTDDSLETDLQNQTSSAQSSAPAQSMPLRIILLSSIVILFGIVVWLIWRIRRRSSE